MTLRLPGLQRHLPIRRLLNTPDPPSAAPPGKDSGRGAACVPGGASLTRPTKSSTYQKVTQHPRSGKRRRARTAGAVPLVCRVALRLPGLQRHLPIRRLLNTPDPASAAGQRQQARSRLCAGWRFAYPAYKVIYLSEGYSTPQVRQAPRRPASAAGAEPLVCRVAATPYPAWSSCDLSLIYPLVRLKLPVLAASKSLRRSRKAGAARMDAG
ncbi:hypothetical protein SAMN03159295_04146 [Klebsiella quasipneumoniae]|nr:hypothetical protein SAMN03159295_04146 [Klebsiella quasipneumoniae]